MIERHFLITFNTYSFVDPARPTNLVLSQVGGQRVQATWTSSLSEATFRVYINTADINTGGVPVNETSYTAANVFPAGSNVTVIVRSTTGTYLSLPSDSASLIIIGKYMERD